MILRLIKQCFNLLTNPTHKTYKFIHPPSIYLDAPPIHPPSIRLENSSTYTTHVLMGPPPLIHPPSLSLQNVTHPPLICLENSFAYTTQQMYWWAHPSTQSRLFLTAPFPWSKVTCSVGSSVKVKPQLFSNRSIVPIIFRLSVFYLCVH